MAFSAFRPALFTLDPELAHRFALDAARLYGHLPSRPLAGSPVSLMGLRFPNRLGLAAGFDKNAVAVGNHRHQHHDSPRQFDDG